MATWRKVITSGSQANLATVQVDNLTSGQVVIGGGQGSNLTTTPINGTGNIVATTGASGLSHSGSFSGSFSGISSGSFSGSFAGDGSGLTGVIATNPNALTNGEGISAFSYNGLTAQQVAISGAADLTDNIIVKWDNTANKVKVSSITDDGTTVSGTTSLQFSGANSKLTGSFTGSFSGIGSGSFSGSFTGPLTGNATTATTATQVANALSFAGGVSGSSATYNGSAAVNFSVGKGALITVADDFVQVTTSSLTTNQIPKYSADALAGSNISDTGTQVQISAGASSGLLINAGGITVSAGGVNVTGNSTFANNVSITGDLTVAGTASFQNTQNLLIGDRFAALASGSTTLTDGGIIVISSTSAANGMSGSALYLEVGTGTDTGNYGRFAVAPNVHASASVVVADEWVVTAKQSTTAPGATTPTWGGNTNNAAGNMWVDTTNGNIYIWA